MKDKLLSITYLLIKYFNKFLVYVNTTTDPNHDFGVGSNVMVVTSYKNPEIEKLKRIIEEKDKEINTLKAELKAVEKIFNKDQLDHLKHGTLQGKKWSKETLKESLQLQLTAGTTAYNKL